jgi:hypothetical protein
VQTHFTLDLLAQPTIAAALVDALLVHPLRPNALDRGNERHLYQMGKQDCPVTE